MPSHHMVLLMHYHVYGSIKGAYKSIVCRKLVGMLITARVHKGTVEPLLRGHPDARPPLLKGHFSGATVYNYVCVFVFALINACLFTNTLVIEI